MDFVIYTGNHDNSNGIGDTVVLLRNALRDCGHRAGLSAKIVPGCINVMLEHCVHERHLNELLQGRAAGARYVIIGTEPIIGGTFNGGIDGSHFHYSNTPYWRLRFDAFKIAAGMAEAVWVLAESMLPGYTELLPQLPVRFLPHGWVSGFDAVHRLPDDEQDIDFFFSGSLTEHRRNILTRLANYYRVGYQTPGMPDYLRLDHLARARVCLSLRLSPSNAIPSVSRMHYYLQNRCFMLHEPYELPSLLDPYVLTSAPDDVVGWAEAALQLPNRQQIADDAHDHFKADMPMTRLLPPLVDEVLHRVDSAGKVSTLRQAA
jgi:hypothetical protein